MIVPGNLAMPKTIHFIWIGSPIPDKYVANVERFRLLNPSHTVNLWLDHEAKPIQGVRQRRAGVGLVNQDAYDSEGNLGAKADILRYEVVYAEGGIYNDVDAICLKPFDESFAKAFVSHTFEPWNNLTNAVFGFPPRHHFIAALLSAIPHATGSVAERTGPMFFTQIFLNHHKLKWADVLSAPVNFVHQDLLIFPRRSSSVGRKVGFTYHLNDANWTDEPRRRSASRVSMCTAIKNRLMHFRETLPQNVADAGPDVEFCVLDYDSDDGLAEWLKPFVLNGLVSLHRARDERYWRMAHAKNACKRLAVSPVVCNVDADNFIMPGFSQHVIDFFESKGGVLAGPPAVEGVTGRLAMRKADFEAIGGYDEDFRYGWGCEDIDLVARVKALGHPVEFIDLKFLKQIPHDDELRGRHAEMTDIWESNRHSLAIMAQNLKDGRHVANVGRPWGVIRPAG